MLLERKGTQAADCYQSLFSIRIEQKAGVAFEAESDADGTCNDSYFRENEMREGDNPPVGILLCTKKGKKMVDYALAGLDNKLFVSSYMLSLPDEKVLEEFIIKEIEG